MDPIESQVNERFATFAQQGDTTSLYEALAIIEAAERQTTHSDPVGRRLAVARRLHFLAALGRHLDPRFDPADKPVVGAPPPPGYSGVVYPSGEVDPATEFDYAVVKGGLQSVILRETDKLKKQLEAGRLAKYFINEYKATHAPDDYKHFHDLNLLTDKHVLYVANVNDKNILGNEYSKIVQDIAQKEGEEAIVLSVGIESELSQLEADETVSYTHLTLPTNREV